jgi:CTP synthase
VIEYARTVLGLKGANSTEFDEATVHPVVLFMPEIDQKVMGGTMRLGARATTVSPTLKDGSSSLAREVYGFPPTESGAEGGDDMGSSTDHGYDSAGIPMTVMERHRHRYEVNPEKVSAIEKCGEGLLFTGRDDQGVRMEIAELSRKQHPFYFGTQFHPEFKSRPNRPSPPFYAFVVASRAAATPSKAAESDLSLAGSMWRSHEATLMMAAAEMALMMSPRKRDRASSSVSEVGSIEKMTKKEREQA